MKKLAFLAVTALLFVACSKDQRMSRKLDGTWNLETYDGKAPASGDSESVAFTKDKDGAGKAVYSYKNGNYSGSVTFDYRVDGDYLITSLTENNVTYSDTATIVTLKGKDLELKDSDNKVSKYSKQ